MLDGHIESFIFASSYFKLRSKPVILSDYSEILIVLFTVLRFLLKKVLNHKTKHQAMFGTKTAF